MLRWCIACFLLAAGCSSDERDADPTASPVVASDETKNSDNHEPAAPAATPDLSAPTDSASIAFDAGLSDGSAAATDGGTADADAIGYALRPVRPHRRNAPALDLVLRSSPAGAAVAVDGVSVGRTPTFWQGRADGIAREFTFSKTGYAMARYRFVPTHSGVVHGTLKPIVSKKPGADTDKARHRPAPNNSN